MRAAGRPIAVDDRRFTIALDELPSRPIAVVAADEAGNRSTRRVRVVLEPRRPPVPIRAVHVTAHAWASAPLRRSVLQLVDEGRINSVELDIKDEAGLVGFDADVPLGRRIGAVEDVYDLEEAVETLHARGVWVIGRLVAFRDPIHAAAAWQRRPARRGRPDARGRPVRGLRRLHELREPRGPSLQHRRRARGGEGRRRRHPLRLHPPARRAAELDGVPGSSRARRRRRSRASSTRASARSGRTASSSARRSSAWPRRARSRSRRTSGAWRARSTTSRRWSTRRTGGPASTTSRTRTRSRTRSCAARSSTSCARRQGHGRARRPVAAGLLARRRLRPDGGPRADPRLARRRHLRVHPLGPARHLHGRRARRAARRRPRSSPRRAAEAEAANAFDVRLPSARTSSARCR